MSKVEELAEQIKEELGSYYFEFPDLGQADANRTVDALVQAGADQSAKSRAVMRVIEGGAK